ncbi:MAG TPA: DUF192 domain-containing protein [Acidimicrobiales bacterium]
MREDEVLAVAEMADSFVARNKGLIGRPEYEGAFLIPHTSGALHSVGMRFALDVAFLDRDLAVVDTVRLTPWHITRPRRRCRTVLEAQSGAFERWRLRPGDRLELHDTK